MAEVDRTKSPRYRGRRMLCVVIQPPLSGGVSAMVFQDLRCDLSKYSSRVAVVCIEYSSWGERSHDEGWILN